MRGVLTPRRVRWLLSALLGLLCPLATARADWPTYQQNTQRTGSTAEQLDALRLAPLWTWRSAETPRPAWAGPAMWDAYAGIRDLPAMRDYDAVPHVIAVDGLVYFGSTTDDTLRCLDGATGKLRWRFTADGPIRLPPMWHANRVYFGSDDGHAYCLDAADGQQRWSVAAQPADRWLINNGRFISPTPVRTGVVVRDGLAYFGAALLPWTKSYLCSVDAESGRFDVDGGFRIELDGRTLEGSPALTDDQLVFPQGRVAPQLFRRRDGLDLGPLEKSSGGSIVIVSEETVLHGPGAESRRGALATSSSRSRQRIATFGRGSAMCVDGAIAYMLGDGQLAAADLGSRKHRFQVSDAPSLSLIKAGDTLFAGGVDLVAAYSAADGSLLWRHDAPGRVKGLAVADGQLYVSTDEGVVMAFAATALPSPATPSQSSNANPSNPSKTSSTSNTIAAADEDQSPVESPREPGLIGHWEFQRDQLRSRGGQVAIRDRAGRQPAVLEGAFRWRRGQGAGEGELPEHIEWSGRGAAIVQADHNHAQLPARELTAEAVVRVDRPLKWGGIIGAIQDNGNFERGWLLGHVDGKFSFALCGSETQGAARGRLTYMAADQPFQLGEWAHLAATYDGSVMRLFVNGELAAQSKEQSGPVFYPPKAPFLIGAYRDDNENYPMEGGLQQVRLYDRALSAAEVKQHFAAAEDILSQLKPPPAAHLALGPILQFDSRQTAVVQWQTERPRKCWLEWWPESGGAIHRVNCPPDQTKHQARLFALRPDRRYVYRIVLEDDQGQLRSTEEHLCDTFFNYLPSRPESGADQAHEAHSRLIDAIPQADRGGLCLVWGAGLAREAELLRANYRVVVMDPDPDKVAQLRAHWLERHIYGSSLTARVAPATQDLSPLPGDWANLIVSDRYVPALERQLKPGRGWWLQQAVDGEDEPKPLDVVTSSALRVDDSAWRRYRRLHWPQIGQWSHLYGSADNSAFTGESLAGISDSGQLQVQWVGRPGPRYQADRSGRKPSPLASNGRLFLQGWRRIVALDSHNGEPLWSLELPGFERFNVPRDCSNWCSDENSVFATVADRVLQLDAATGQLVRTLTLPELAPSALSALSGPSATQGKENGQPDKQLAWGYVSRVSGRLLGTAVQADAMWTNFWGDAAAGWYDAKSGEVTSHVASDALFSYAMNPSSADTPALQWVYRGLVLNSTITAADNRIWLLECRNEEARASAARRLDGDRIWKDVWLICLNAKDGTKRWEQPLDTPPGSVMVSMAQRDGRLVLVTSSANRFHVTCFSDKGGEPLWRESAPWGRDNHGGHMSRPAIVAGNVYVRPFTFRLEDGKPQPQRMPVGGCGTYACTDNALFFRQSTVTVWDRATAKTSTWPRLRPDCWLSTIPADGMLLSPEGGGGCSCGTWLETSLGFKPVKSAN
ncbi:MAG: PQQ-binding-like beta-propeller repeat protein [Planctomycetales bacterium]|nr:PQQ-binding-like beta-propeller repeat protein [Planctomycetales bacterium]